MSELTKKVLESGLVDKATAELMERWGYLKPGSADAVKEDALKDATKSTLTKLAEDLGEEVEKQYHMRETYMDLERIRWPVNVDIIEWIKFHPEAKNSRRYLSFNLRGVIDRMGRYYFRIQDVKEAWFTPGNTIVSDLPPSTDGAASERGKLETITESQILYVNEQPVCWQVSVKPQVEV
jgi:hypothetical protein